MSVMGYLKLMGECVPQTMFWQSNGSSTVVRTNSASSINTFDFPAEYESDDDKNFSIIQETTYNTEFELSDTGELNINSHYTLCRALECTDEASLEQRLWKNLTFSIRDNRKVHHEILKPTFSNSKNHKSGHF